MADTFIFELVSPERLLISEAATIVTLPGADGDMGVLANHAPVMTGLRPGVLVVTKETGEEESYFVRGGFADIAGPSVTVLAEFAVPTSDLTKDMFDAQVAAAKEEHEAALKDGDEAKIANTQAYVDQLTHMESTLISA
ncbi:MAG: F0F1 ATP synthase subunit epsilon [Pseudomonadota bacterium]